MNRFEGKVAVVTGAASGIGRATATRLADEGATVIATDINDADCAQVEKELQRTHGRGRFLTLDVTDADGWQTVIDTTVEQHGGLDVLVNNAGIGDLRSIEDSTKESFERVIAILQTGVFLGMKFAGPALKQAGGGAVVNISSMFGMVGAIGPSPAYHAAKGAVRNMSKGMAVAWAAEGIRVNSVHPGFIETPMLEGAGDDQLGHLIPMNRVGTAAEVAAAIAFVACHESYSGTAAEVAAAIAFVASDDASYITGAEIACDGGYVAQ